MQSAYSSKKNDDRILLGSDKWSKYLVIMALFVIALVINLFNIVYHPELNNKHLSMISMRYCFLHLDDGYGAILSASQHVTGRYLDNFKQI